MTTEMYDLLKQDILPLLKYDIVKDNPKYSEKVEFVITLDIFGTYIRLKKFTKEDFLYIDGFIHFTKPIPEAIMIGLHSVIDNHLRVGINVDTEDEEEGPIIRNMLIHCRLYKDNLTIGNIEREVIIIYNCMNKVTGMLIGMENIMAIKGHKDGENGIVVNNGDELKSYG
jgi:hypothetical protein